MSIISTPPSAPLVAPSILSADFADLGRECRKALDAGGDLLHLDVMDGHFVPNLTMGPALCASLRKALPDAFLDGHLMVSNPELFVQPFAEAGCNHLTFHIEVDSEPADLARRIRQAGMTAGLAINPPTDVSLILPHIEHFDLILVMSVNPGFAGQAFMPEVLQKARQIKPLLNSNQRLQIDGGVNISTAGACLGAGCDIIVAASAVFKADDYAQAVADLRNAQPNPEFQPASWRT